MNYYIFRHGQTHFSKFDITYGDQIETAELLPEGIPVVEKLANYLKNISTDANFTSPYKRCKDTSEIIEKATGKTFEADIRLHDYNNETIDDMASRLKKFLTEIQNANYQSVALCTHGYPIALLKDLIINNRFEIDNLNTYPKTGVLMIIEDKNVKYLDFNS